MNIFKFNLKTTIGMASDAFRHKWGAVNGKKSCLSVYSRIKHSENVVEDNTKNIGSSNRFNI